MRHVASALLVSPLVVLPLLTGCGNLASTSAPVASPGVPMLGRVHGGQQPVTGANVQLYAASTAGYGTASTPLLTSPVTTDAQGGFNITGDYTCPSANTQVYLLATGGNPGFPPGTNNPAISLMAALGACGNLSASTYIVINEVSTVASVYALAGYMTDATHVAASGTPLAATGLANAFATVTNLEDLASGNALSTTPAVPGYAASSGLSANGTVPQSTINTLADILASCINTDGTTTACTTLLTTATLDGTSSGTPALETTTAALNIAHNPGLNVTPLYNLSSSTAPFQPTLPTTPNDFILSLKFTAPNTNAERQIAIDGSGDVWVTNLSSNSVTEFSPTGVVLSGTTGYTNLGFNSPFCIAIDAAGGAWVAGSAGHALTRLSTSGVPLSGTPYTSAYTGCVGIAVDATGDVWLGHGTSLEEFSPSGVSLASTSVPNMPYSIAIGANGDIYSGNAGSSSTFTHFSPSGTLLSTSTSGGVATPRSLSIDATGNIWFANQAGSTLSEFNSAAMPVSPTGYSGGGMTHIMGTRVDGSGRVWTSDMSTGRVGLFSNSGVPLSPSTGYKGAGFTSSWDLQIDGSGNLWISDYSSGKLIEFIGLATPSANPILPTNHGQRP